VRKKKIVSILFLFPRYNFVLVYMQLKKITGFPVKPGMTFAALFDVSREHSTIRPFINPEAIIFSAGNHDPSFYIYFFKFSSATLCLFCNWLFQKTTSSESFEICGVLSIREYKSFIDSHFW
jgi:hypothetical protein